MKQRVKSIIERAKEGLAAKGQLHHPDWPKHHLLCNCRKCMAQELTYIKEMKKEHRQKKARAKQKAGK